MEDDQQERQGRDDRRRAEHPEHDRVHRPTPKRGNFSRRRRHAARPDAPRDVCQTSQRATAFTIRVITNSTNPTASSDDSCRPSDSRTLLAMSEAIVFDGAMSDAEMMS